MTITLSREEHGTKNYRFTDVPSTLVVVNAMEIR